MIDHIIIDTSDSEPAIVLKLDQVNVVPGAKRAKRWEYMYCEYCQFAAKCEVLDLKKLHEYVQHLLVLKHLLTGALMFIWHRRFQCRIRYTLRCNVIFPNVKLVLGSSSCLISAATNNALGTH